MEKIMHTLRQWMFSNRLSKTIVTCLAGLLLILNVACSAPQVSRPAPEDIYSPDKQGNPSAMTERDGSLSENNPRATARARELIDNSKKNAANPNKAENLLEQARQSANELPGQATERVKEQKDGLVKRTERGVKNLKEASKEIPDVVKEATDRAQAQLN
jgi:hypothetical protein